MASLPTGMDLVLVGDKICMQTQSGTVIEHILLFQSSFVDTGFPGHTKTTILRIWLISFRSWSSRIFRLPSITVFMLVILSWTVEKPSLHSRFRRANSSFCVAAICSRRATILFSKCWIKNLIKSFFEYRSFLTF